MRTLVRDALDSTLTCVPHRARKWLATKVFAVIHLLTPPHCADRSCCWTSAKAGTISGCAPPDIDSATCGHLAADHDTTGCQQHLCWCSLNPAQLATLGTITCGTPIADRRAGL